MSWRVGVSTGCSLDTPIGEVVAAMKAAGIDGVEIGTPPRHFDPMQRHQVTQLAEQLAALGIHPVSIHAPFGGLLDLSDPNPHHRYAAIGAVLTCASVIRQLGGSIIVAHTSDTPRDAHTISQRLAHSTESLRVLLRACRDMGLTLAVETPLPHLVGGHPDEFATILRDLGADARVCLDTGHTTLGHFWDRFIAVAGDRLAHVHASDNHGRFDDHLPPGDGRIDWRHIAATLGACEYDGWVVLELACPQGPLVDHIARAAGQARGFFGDTGRAQGPRSAGAHARAHGLET